VISFVDKIRNIGAVIGLVQFKQRTILAFSLSPSFFCVLAELRMNKPPFTMNSRLFNQSTSSRSRRFILYGLLILLTSTSYYIYFGRSFKLDRSFDLERLDQPPKYKRLIEWEENLPQHNLDLPFPEGRTGRYVLFKNQIQGLGWNNELNEV